jgi:hypothetical protein
MNGQPAHALREIASGDDLAVSRDELTEGIEGCLIDVLSDG